MLSLGQVIADRYRVLEYVGKGGMGAVYRARDLTLDAEIALKVLDDVLVSDPRRISDFRSEVKLARMVTHRNVCRIHDIVEADGLVFITMQYVEGDTLAERLERTDAVPVEWAIRVLRDVTRGLAAAHAADVIHRDLKPSNVLLGENERAIVADFGIAAEATRFGKTAATLAGTRGYMSPEQAAGDALDARSDIYSLGMLAVELFGADVPAEIAEFIQTCVQKSPDDRPADASVALRMLESSVEPTGPATVVTGAAPTRWRSRRGAVVVAAVLALTAAAWVIGGLRKPWITNEKPVVVVASLDKSQLRLQENWLADALQRQLVNELRYAWGVEAKVDDGKQISRPTIHVRGTLTRDNTHRLYLVADAADGHYELEADTVRELAKDLGGRVATDTIAPAFLRPTPEDLTATGTSDTEAWRQLQRARREATMQNWARERILLRDAIEKDPKFVMAWLELSLAYDEEDEAGARALERALELAADAPQLDAFATVALEIAKGIRKQDLDTASARFESLEKLELDELTRHYALMRWAMMWVFIGEHDKGVPRLTWIAEKWPDNAAAPKALAAHYLGYAETLDAKKAHRYAAQAVAAAPEDIEVRADLARALLLLDNRDAARANGVILGQADPEEKREAESIFEWHMMVGDLEEASIDARRFLTGTPAQKAIGLASMGWVDANRGAFAPAFRKWDESANAYETVGMQGGAAALRVRRAWVAYNLGNYEDALSSAKAAARVPRPVPTQRWAAFLEALAEHATGRGELAAIDKAAAAFPPGSPQAIRAALLLAYAKKDYSATARLHGELEAATGQIDTLYVAADALLRLGDRERGRRLLERLVAHPNAWRVPVSRGRALRRLGELAEEDQRVDAARERYQQLLALWNRAPADHPDLDFAQARIRAMETKP